MKKMISISLCAAMVMTLCMGCGSAGNTEEAAVEEAAVQTETADTAETDAVAADTAAGEAAAGEGRVFGYVTQTLDNPYFVTISDSLKAGLKEGDELIVLDSVSDINNEIDNMNDLISRKVDLIFISTQDAAGIVPTLQEATAAGIPVICVDTPLNDPTLVVTTVCSDNYQGGVICAQKLAEAIGEEGKVGAYIYSNNVVCGLRGQGFLDTMEKDYPNIEVVVHDGGLPTVASAMPIMEDLLTANPDLKGLFAYNDPAAIGCSAAIKAAGLSDQVLVLGMDGSDEGAELMKVGEMFGSATQYPDEMGSTAMSLAYKYLGGEEVDNENYIEVGYLDASGVE